MRVEQLAQHNLSSSSSSITGAFSNTNLSQETAAWAAASYLELACSPDVIKHGAATVKHYMDSSAHYALLARAIRKEN